MFTDNPQPTDETRNRYDYRSHRPMGKFLRLSVTAQRESVDAYLTFDELTEYAREAAQLVERAHYYGGSILEMHFEFNGRHYEIESNEDDQTYIYCTSGEE